MLNCFESDLLFCLNLTEVKPALSAVDSKSLYNTGRPVADPTDDVLC